MASSDRKFISIDSMELLRRVQRVQVIVGDETNSYSPAISGTFALAYGSTGARTRDIAFDAEPERLRDELEILHGVHAVQVTRQEAQVMLPMTANVPIAVSSFVDISAPGVTGLFAVTDRIWLGGEKFTVKSIESGGMRVYLGEAGDANTIDYIARP